MTDLQEAPPVCVPAVVADRRSTVTDLAGSWSCPGAVRLQASGVSRAEWLAARREGVGGSELAALLGECRYDSAYGVWLDKTSDPGVPVLDVPSEAMLWGQRLEAAVADAFAEEHGLQVRRAGLMRSRAYPRMQASVDRLTCDGGGLEVKCVGFFTGRQLDGDAIPPEWFWQCVHYLTVTGRSHWWLAVLVGGQRLVVRRLDAAEHRDDMQRAVEAVARFWAEHVATGIPPADGAPVAPPPLVAGSRVEAPLPGQALADTARWRALDRQTRQLAGELAVVKGRLADQIGDAHLLTVAGRPLVRRVVRRGATRLDVSALRRAEPQLAARFTITGPPGSHLELYQDDTTSRTPRHPPKEEAA